MIIYASLMITSLVMVTGIFACVLHHVDRPQAQIKREELVGLKEEETGAVMI